MAWSFEPGRAVYIQVAERIRRNVITGKYASGEQIPSVRALAQEAAVNPNTVQHTFTELESEGILVSRGTSGRFVTDDKAVIERARLKEARALVSDFVSSTVELSISKEEILRYIKEDFDERS